MTRAICLLASFFALLVPTANTNAQEPASLHVPMGHASHVNALAISADGKWLATAAEDDTARLWELASGKEIRVFRGHTHRVSSVAFSADGKRFVTGSHDKTARLWDPASRQALRSFADGDEVYAVAISPDSKWVVTAGKSNAPKLWEAETGKEVRAFASHTGSVLAVAISRDGKHLFTAGEDKTARRFELDTGKQDRLFKGHEDWVRCLAVSEDGKTLVSGSRDRTARVWEVAAGKPNRVLHHPDQVQAVALADDGTIATGCNDKLARLWKTDADKEPRTFSGHANSFVTSVALSRDGKWLVAGSIGWKDSPWLWETGTGKDVHAFAGLTSPVTAAALHGKSLIAAHADGVARLWDLGQGKEVRSFKKHTDALTSVSISGDGKWLATGSLDGTARFWDLASGKPLRDLEVQQAVMAVTLNSDGKFLVVAANNMPRLYDTGEGKEIAKLQPYGSQIRGIALSADGAVLVTSGTQENNCRMWHIRKDKFMAQLFRYMWCQAPINCVAVSKDGQWVLAGCNDGIIRVLDTRRGIRNIPGHTKEVWCVALSADDSRVLSGSWDKTARVFDQPSGKQVCQVHHDDLVTGVALSEDGKRFLTASRDNTIRVWDVATAKELCKLISYRDGSWAVFDTDGRYDCETPDGMPGLYFVRGTDTIPLGQFRKGFHTPGLLTQCVTSK